MQIQVLKKATDILDTLARNKGRQISLSEIADSLSLNRGTCANILKTMVELDLVCQPDRRKGYMLGRRLFELAGESTDEEPLLKFSYPLIDELSRRTNENVLLSVIRNYRRSLLHTAFGDHEVEARTSDNISVYKAVTGRMILAHYTPEQIDSVVEEIGLPGDDWPEIKSREDLDRELKSIKGREYIISTNKHHVLSIAVPIFHHGRVIASLGYYLPACRADIRHLDFLVKEILQTAGEINSHLS